jgi:ketosteroid isomerase-like protein
MAIKQTLGTIIAALLSALMVAQARAELAPAGFPLREPCIVPGAEELRRQYGAGDLSSEAKEIMELEREACRMFGDPRTIEQAFDLIFDPNVRILHMNGPIKGSVVSKRMFKAYFEAGYDMKFEPIEARVYESGKVAWVIGVLDETMPDGSVERGKYVAIWEKKNGKWKNVLDMRNANGGIPLVSP